MYMVLIFNTDIQPPHTPPGPRTTTVSHAHTRIIALVCGFVHISPEFRHIICFQTPSHDV